eukprot:6464403-Amphidinium_carterae.1
MPSDFPLWSLFSSGLEDPSWDALVREAEVASETAEAALKEVLTSCLPLLVTCVAFSRYNAFKTLNE